MKTKYIEKIPYQQIEHKIIVCDNPNCKKVIIDNGKRLEEYHQGGKEKGGLYDACSEKCLKKLVKIKKKINPPTRVGN